MDEARGNQSLVQMHNLTLVDLGLFFGNYVRIMGNVKLSSVGIAVGCDKVNTQANRCLPVHCRLLPCWLRLVLSKGHLSPPPHHTTRCVC